MATIINVANFKGGVGKTTTTVLTSYILAKRGYKTLVVDMDPQANATDLLTRTAEIDNIDTSVYQAMQDEDLLKCRVEIADNLDLLPAGLDLVGFPILLNEVVKDDNYKRAYYLDYLLRPAHEMYDYIMIDVPPTISDYTNNAIIASDYIMVVMQTHERSLSAAEKFMPYLEGMVDNYNAHAKMLGIVPVLMKIDGTVDSYMLELAMDTFKERLFKTKIKLRERIKRWDVNGISEEDHHDQNALDMYDKLVSEMMDRLSEDQKGSLESQTTSHMA